MNETTTLEYGTALAGRDSSELLESIRSAADTLRSMPPVAVGIICSPADYDAIREMAAPADCALGFGGLQIAADSDQARGSIDVYYDSDKWRERLRELNERSNGSRAERPE